MKHYELTDLNYSELLTAITNTSKIKDIIREYQLIVPGDAIPFYIRCDDSSHSIITRTAVQALTRRFRASVSLDLLNDHTPGIADALAEAVVHELHNEMSDIIYNSSTLVNYRLDSELDSPERIVGKLQDASNLIYAQTKINTGNKWILPYDLYCEILPVIINDLDIPESVSNFSDLLFVGNWYGVDIYTTLRNTVALVGYTGNDMFDCGLVYCPYNWALKPYEENGDLITPVLHRYGYAKHLNIENYFVSLQVR